MVLSVTAIPSSGLPQQEQFHNGFHYPAHVLTSLTVLELSGSVLSVFQWGSKQSTHIWLVFLESLLHRFPQHPSLSLPQQCVALIVIEARPLSRSGVF